jgi:hypothetical protein
MGESGAVPVKERMAAQTMVDANELATAMAQAIAGLAPKPELKEGDPEYVERQKAEGWFDDFFGVKVLQNAYEAQARGLSEETRRRTSQLKPGRYIKTKQNPDGRVTVEVHKGGSEIRLLYPVSGDAMSINRDHWSSFEDLINKIWAEMG